MRSLGLAVGVAVTLAASACGGGGKPVKPGNAAKGARIYASTCATCHGTAGSGGSAPRLVGEHISRDTAKARIDGGGSGMPAGLVSGQDEEDVLAYLQQIGG